MSLYRFFVGFAVAIVYANQLLPFDNDKFARILFCNSFSVPSKETNVFVKHHTVNINSPIRDQ